MRDLSKSEIESLLERRKVGRLGIWDPHRERVYVVPVSYWYGDGAAHMHSAPGLKLDLLEDQPAQVCFEVEDIADEGEWQTVIGWGRFEEITEPHERLRVLRTFGDRLQRGPLRDHNSVGRGGMLGAGEIVYKLAFEEMTGRADSSGWIGRESD